MQEYSFTVLSAGRLDLFLSEHLTEQSRSFIKKLIQKGEVWVNQVPVSKAGAKLQVGDTVICRIPPPEKLSIEAENIPLDIVYEDSELIILNKPIDTVVHPGAGHASGTLVNALLFHCKDLSGIGGVERPGIVHRLDKDTSGLLAIAKTDRAHRSLSEQLKTRSMKRYYYALAEGGFKEQEGFIEAPIARHPVDRKKMAVVKEGRYAKTRWQLVDSNGKYTWLRLSLDTGRTHQIRVHLKHIQRPLVGDAVYGTRSKHPFKVERPLLHAYGLGLIHPVTQESLFFEIPIAKDFERILNILAFTPHEVNNSV